MRQFKIRMLNRKEPPGENYGIAVPKQIAIEFMEIKFTVYKSGNAIIYESGCLLNEKKKVVNWI